MSLFELPASGAVSAEDGPTRPWFPWFRKVTDTCNSVRQSGTTTQRPTKGLWIGRPYFDTSLGYEVFFDGSTWVGGSGGGGGSGTVTSVGLTAPAAGITVAGSPITTAGSFTLALAGDLAALEALATTGYAKRTGASTWATSAAIPYSDLTGTPTIPAATNAVTVTVDFGAAFTDKATLVVTGQAWVTASSNIVVSSKVPAGVDPDELYLIDFRWYVSDIVAGTGFTLTVYSSPEARGTYDFMCIGI
jgi:hypothetical protein